MMEQPSSGSLVFGGGPVSDFIGSTPQPYPAFNVDGTQKIWQPGERLLLYGLTITTSGCGANQVFVYFLTDPTGDPTSTKIELFRFRSSAGIPFSFPNGYGNYLACPVVPVGVDQGQTPGNYQPLAIKVTSCPGVSVKFVGMTIGRTSGINGAGFPG